MKKFNIIFLGLIFLGLKAFPQGGAIEFDNTTHDFGTIREEGGPAIHEFKFTNKGSIPLVISDVKASCGCTTPAWSKEPVMPGKTGFIKAQFDTQNRPGIFNKSLTVTSNAEPSTSILFIKGTVTPKPKLPTDEFPDTLGNLRMTTRNINFASITTKEPVVKEVKIYNNGNDPITVSNPTNLPKFLKLSIEPKTIPAKQSAVLKLTYDAKIKNDLGYVSDPFILPTTDTKSPKKNLMVSATISEYFPALSAEELETAPKISFTKATHDFGNVTEGKVATTEFEYSNTGKKELVLRKAVASCGCTAGTIEKKVLKPGEKGKIKVSFNSTGRAGAETKTVSVYSNDPTDPVHTLTIKSNVVK